MLNIIKENDEQFRVNCNDVSSDKLSLEQLFKVMRGLEVEFDELECALTDLVINDNRVAEFGINRTFIYSYK